MVNAVAAAAIDSPALERSVRRKLEANRLGDLYIIQKKKEKRVQKGVTSNGLLFIKVVARWLIIRTELVGGSWTSSADGGAFAYRLEIVKKRDPWAKKTHSTLYSRGRFFFFLSKSAWLRISKLFAATPRQPSVEYAGARRMQRVTNPNWMVAVPVLFVKPHSRLGIPLRSWRVVADKVLSLVPRSSK